MLNKIEQNSIKFALVSDDLAEISRYMQSESGQSHFAMRSWTRVVDLSIFETPYFDEREALQAAGILMKNLMVFTFLPAHVLKLQTHYMEALSGGDDYLKYALTAQKDRLTEQVRGVPPMPEIEKTLRNVRRGIERAIDDLDSANDVDAHLSSFFTRLPRHQREVTRVDQQTGELVIDHDKAWGIVEKFLVKIQNKIDKAYGRFLGLEDAEFILERQLDRRRIVDYFLEPTLRDLQTLSKPKGVIPMQIEPADQGDESINRKRKRLSSEPPESKLQDVQTPTKKNSEKLDSLQMTIAKIKRVIDVAHGSGNKLRILIPPENRLRDRFEPQWRNVLSRMGFKGFVEFITYENLRATSDIETPVIVYKGMNTHGNLWDKSKFSNTVVVDFVPALIANSLDKK